MRSGEYFYKSKRIDGKPLRVYVGSLADPSVAGMKQLAASIREARERENSTRRAVEAGFRALLAASGMACDQLLAQATKDLDRFGYYRPGRFLWRKRRMKHVVVGGNAAQTVGPIAEKYAAMHDLAERVRAGDPSASEAYSAALRASPEVSRLLDVVEKRRIAASLIAAIAPDPAYRIERLAQFDVRVADLAGMSGSPASLALAVRAALLKVELDAAAAYLREQARAGVPSGVIEWLERRRDTLERRYLAAVRSVVGLSRVLILNIEAPAPAATPESPSLSIVA